MRVAACFDRLQLGVWKRKRPTESVDRAWVRTRNCSSATIGMDHHSCPGPVRDLEGSAFRGRPGQARGGTLSGGVPRARNRFTGGIGAWVDHRRIRRCPVGGVGGWMPSISFPRKVARNGDHPQRIRKNGPDPRAASSSPRHADRVPSLGLPPRCPTGLQAFLAVDPTVAAIQWGVTAGVVLPVYRPRTRSPALLGSLAVNQPPMASRRRTDT